MTALSPVAAVGVYEDWWIQILKAIVLFAVALQILPAVIIMERKLLGRFQMRYGPNRVGPYGAMQPLAEIVKFAVKQDFRPKTAIGLLYTLAPAISIITAVSAFAIVPFGDTVDIFGKTVGLYGIDVQIGRASCRERV